MRGRIVTTAVLCALVATTVHAAPAQGVKTKVISISEVRRKDFGVEKRPRFGSDKAGLTVTVELSGEAVEKAFRFGHLKITAAKDDTGASLKVSAKSFNDPTKGYVKIDRRMMYFGLRSGPPKDKIKVDLKFQPTARAAKTIRVLEGSLKLLTGEPKAIRFPSVKGKVGQVLENPTLKSLRLTLKVVQPKKGAFFGPSDPEKSVTVELTGDAKKVLQIGLADAAGKKINTTSMRSSFGNKTTYTFQAERKLAPDTALAISVALGRKTVEVPFRLTNLPLP